MRDLSINGIIILKWTIKKCNGDMKLICVAQDGDSLQAAVNVFKVQMSSS
jgi:hypothetical protein